jgi:hypothetical protein
MFQGFARRGRDRPDLGKRCLVPRAVAEIFRDDGGDAIRFLFDRCAQPPDVILPLGEIGRPRAQKSLALPGKNIGGFRPSLDVEGFDYAHDNSTLCIRTWMRT